MVTDNASVSTTTLWFRHGLLIVVLCLVLVGVFPPGTIIAQESRTVITYRNVNAVEELLTIQHPHSNGVAYSPDSSILAVATNTGVWLYDDATPEQVRFLEHPHWVWSMDFSPDGSHIVTGTGWPDSSLRVWDVQSGDLLQTWARHPKGVLAVAFSPDGGYIASASFDDVVRLWAAQTGDLYHAIVLPGHSKKTNFAAFSPDGTLLAAGGIDGVARVWDIPTGELLQVLTGHERGVRSLALSRDGDLFAVGSIDDRVRVWNTEDADSSFGPLFTLERHTRAVSSIAFSPDGILLVSGSVDSSMQVWDLQTGELLRVTLGYGGAINSLAFSPDGSRFVSASWEGTIIIWGIP